MSSPSGPRPPYIILGLRAEYRAGRRYELMAPFEVMSAIVGRIHVPQGFVTDFHSIPRLLWNVLPPDDWAEAAVVHDWLCRTHVTAPSPITVPACLGWRFDSFRRTVTRKEADLVHREMVLHCSAALLDEKARKRARRRARAMYCGLQVREGWRKVTGR